jgi:hypothetical protein
MGSGDNRTRMIVSWHLQKSKTECRAELRCSMISNSTLFLHGAYSLTFVPIYSNPNLYRRDPE